MVPTVKLYLVGGYLQDGTLKDIDIMAMLDKRNFELAFGYNHQSLMKAFKEEPDWKLKRYINANKFAGWALSGIFGKKVDFKWCLPTMLYAPYVKLDIELDVMNLFDKRDIHLQRQTKPD